MLAMKLYNMKKTAGCSGKHEFMEGTSDNNIDSILDGNSENLVVTSLSVRLDTAELFGEILFCLFAFLGTCAGILKEKDFVASSVIERRSIILRLSLNIFSIFSGSLNVWYWSAQESAPCLLSNQ